MGDEGAAMVALRGSLEESVAWAAEWSVTVELVVGATVR